MMTYGISVKRPLIDPAARLTPQTSVCRRLQSQSVRHVNAWQCLLIGILLKDALSFFLATHISLSLVQTYDDFRIVHVYLEVKKLEKVYMGLMRSDI
jgi:hypothetical protein